MIVVVKRSRLSKNANVTQKRRLRNISVREVGKAFYDGLEASGGTGGNIKTIKRGKDLLMIGYGWAIYGKKNLKTGKVTYYEGWYGYSPTTSKHLSQVGLTWKHDVKSKESPQL